MSNIITKFTLRIEEHRLENKNPCKSYATRENAEKATQKMAKEAAIYFSRNGDQDTPEADYLVFYIESWGRWVGIINVTELLRRSNSTGGYLGFCEGFYVW